MHACSHDAHVAIRLGVAELLAGCAHRGVLPGKIKLMFQPAEEGLGGAQRMLADMDAAGLTADVGLVLGLHVSSQHDAAGYSTIKQPRLIHPMPALIHLSLTPHIRPDQDNLT